MAAESYQGDQMLTTSDLVSETERANLLRGSCNDDPFEDPFEGSEYGTLT